MTQKEMKELLGVSERTLRDWKKGKRGKLYKLLETLGADDARELLAAHNDDDLRKLLENEKYFTSSLDFERRLYPVLTSQRDASVWKKLARDTTLSLQARSRAAYLYSFLTDKPLKLGFKTKPDTGLYHGNQPETGDGLAKYYGLRNGLDMARFNQYKMTGGF